MWKCHASLLYALFRVMSSVYSSDTWLVRSTDKSVSQDTDYCWGAVGHRHQLRNSDNFNNTSNKSSVMQIFSMKIWFSQQPELSTPSIASTTTRHKAQVQCHQSYRTVIVTALDKKFARQEFSDQSGPTLEPVEPTIRVSLKLVTKRKSSPCTFCDIVRLSIAK